MRRAIPAILLLAAAAAALLVFIVGSYSMVALALLCAALVALLVLALLERPFKTVEAIICVFVALSAAFIPLAIYGESARAAAAVLSLACAAVALAVYSVREAPAKTQAMPELEDEFYVEQVKPRPHPTHTDKLLSRAGTKVYHRARCRALHGAEPSSLVELNSVEEAEAFGLEAYRICRP